MIGKAKSNGSLTATIEYNLKEKAELFYTNELTGTTIEEYQMQMQDLQKCYQGYAKRLTIHAILSPHISEGKNLSRQQWEKIAGEYLTGMNLKGHQAIGFIHRDKEHRHLHLVINKVNDWQHKLYNDSFIGKRTQKVADSIALKMGLIRAMEIKEKNIRERQAALDSLTGNEVQLNDNEKKTEPLGSRQQFRRELKNILEKKNIKNLNDYFEEITKAGYKVLLYHNKETKELRGYGIERNDTKLDASVIGKEFTLKSLQSVFENINNKIEKQDRQWKMKR